MSQFTDSHPPPERIDLALDDDPRDVIHRVVACLAQGGLVSLPTEAGPALAASALHLEALGRLQRLALGGDDARPPIPLVLKSADETCDWVPHLSPLARRLAARVWPGPVTLLIPQPVISPLARRLPTEALTLVTRNDHLALRIPADPLLREVLHLTPGPVLLAATPTLIEQGVDLVLDDPATGPEALPTVVRIDGDTWSIVAPGAVDYPSLVRHAGTQVVFICTGNTCRSPMAEALCKAKLAQRLGCDSDALESQGYVIRSAGLAAGRGQRAAAFAVETVRDRGGSLEAHASRPATPELLSQADHILTMTLDHHDALLDELPELSGRIRLLDPDGHDIPDPYGLDRSTYHHTAPDHRGSPRPSLDRPGPVASFRRPAVARAGPP